MKRTPRIQFTDTLLVAFGTGIGFVLKAPYQILLGWWLDPWLQRRKNRALMIDVSGALHFFVQEADSVSSAETLPFDYAAVEIRWRNLLVIITRGRGETNVSVAPRHVPNELHELGPLIAALDAKNYTDRYVTTSLADAAHLLRSHADTLNSAFSQQRYAQVRQHL